MALLIKVKEGASGDKEALPVWVPDHYAYERHLERLDTLLKAKAKRDREAKDPAFIEAQNKALQDTKPDVYVDRSVPGRTVFAVGAGVHWREDLREIAKRTLERPDPRKNPRLSKRYKIHNDIDTHAWLSKRLPTSKKNFYFNMKGY